MNENTPLLKVDQVGIRFGGLKAVSDLNMELKQGELVGLIGPNGAGKTTFFNLLTGVYVPTEGTVSLAGEKLNGLAPHRITRKGISRTFQNIRLFSELSVLDNVKVAYHSLAKHSMLSSILRLPSYFSGEKEMEEKAIEFLKIFKLEPPSKETSPFFGFNNPEIVFNNVLFPAPFAPIKVTISPSFISRETPFRAWILP